MRHRLVERLPEAGAEPLHALSRARRAAVVLLDRRRAAAVQGQHAEAAAAQAHHVQRSVAPATAARAACSWATSSGRPESTGGPSRSAWVPVATTPSTASCPSSAYRRRNGPSGSPSCRSARVSTHPQLAVGLHLADGERGGHAPQVDADEQVRRAPPRRLRRGGACPFTAVVASGVGSSTLGRRRYQMAPGVGEPARARVRRDQRRFNHAPRGDNAEKQGEAAPRRPTGATAPGGMLWRTGRSSG